MKIKGKINEKPKHNYLYSPFCLQLQWKQAELEHEKEAVCLELKKKNLRLVTEACMEIEKEKAQAEPEKACLQNKESQDRMTHELKMAKTEKVCFLPRIR